MHVRTWPQVGPLFFLNGPGYGGGRWQEECCQLIKKIHGNIFIAAIPHSYCKESKGSFLLKHKAKGEEDAFPSKTSWKRFYMEQASIYGCLLFWMPKAEAGVDHTYAMESRGDLGEWRGRLICQPRLRVVVGIDPDFVGGRAIRENFQIALGENFPIHSTLKETVRAAECKILGLE